MKSVKSIFFLWIPLVVILTVVIRTLITAGEFKKIEPHCDCTCKPITGMGSGEDMEIDEINGILLVSSFDRRRKQLGETIQGGILAYDLKQGDPVLLGDLTSGLPFEFHPHGIHLYESPEGERSLFVVNHRTPTSHFVELFKYKDQKLIHQDSFRAPLLTSPNDVVGVGNREFYVTNDHGMTDPYLRQLEDYLTLPLSYVLYYNGFNFSKVASNISYANGITTSPDGKQLYVTSPSSGQIYVYERNLEKGTLTDLQPIQLGTGADNIEFDREGNLWTGNHPKLLSYTFHSMNEENLSPSQVYKIQILGEGKVNIEEVYLNKGEEISGSSVGIPYKDRFFVGSVYKKHILSCQLNSSKS